MDELIKALAFDGQIRVFVVKATQLVSQAQQNHGTWHTATAALGRSLVATSLLAANLKGEDRLTVQIKGTGPIGLISCEGNGHGQVRGYVTHPQLALELNEVGKLDVATAIGLPGSLQVAKFIGQGQPFTGQVELISGELGEDFTYYMAVSEQTPSAFGLSVLVNPDESVQSAGGFMIQMMPGASEEVISQMEKRIQSISSLATLVEQTEDISSLLDHLVGEGNSRILARLPVEFHCPCDKQRFAKALTGLDPQVLDEMVTEDHGAEIICHYCNTAYSFNEEELIAVRSQQVKN